MYHPQHRVLRFAFTIVSLFAIALATLPPVASNNSPAGFCLICGERGAADAVLNVLLFLPFGMSLAFWRLRRTTAAVIGLALTIAIEVAQFSWIAGRDASAADILFNAAGVLLGYWLAPRVWMALRPSPVQAFRLAVAWLVMLAALPIIYRVGLHPSVSGQTYFPQWTPEIGDDPAYPGELQVVQLGEYTLPRHPLLRSRELEERIAGAPLELRFIAAEPTNHLTTLFAIANDEEVHLLRVSVLHQDLILSWRTRSQAVRFDRPVFRSAGALSALHAGDSVHLRIVRTAARIHVRVNGRVVEEPIRVSGAWALLYFARWTIGYTAVLSIVFVALCVFPFAYWSARASSGAPVLIGGLLIMIAWPLLFRLAPLNFVELLAAGASALLGSLAAHSATRLANRAR